MFECISVGQNNNKYEGEGQRWPTISNTISQQNGKITEDLDHFFNLEFQVASMGWGPSEKQNGTSRPSSRLSLMSRASSEMSINVPMDDDVESNYAEDNMALDMPKPK